MRAGIAGAARPARIECVQQEQEENKAAGIFCLEVDGNISLRGGQRNAQKSSRDDQFVRQVSTPDSRMQNLKERVDFGEWSPTGSALLWFCTLKQTESPKTSNPSDSNHVPNDINMYGE
jgi:hypothetical protein